MIKTKTTRFLHLSGTFQPRRLAFCGAAIAWLASAFLGLAAPSLASTTSLDGQTVALCFAGDLDPTSAGTANLYSIVGATIQSATLLADDRTVLLTVTGLSGASYTVSATGLKDASGNAGNVSGTGPILGWTVQDLGTLPTQSVVYACTPSTIEAEVSGGAVWFNADSGNLISRPRTGDFEVRVQVSKVSGGGGNSNMILDTRETSDPGSRHVAITVYPTQGNWTAFTRVTAGGASSVLSGNWRVAWPAGVNFPNVWMRLRRSGNTFTTYGSTNGLDWVQVGDPSTPDPPYSSSLLVGLATGVTDASVPPLQVEYRDFGDFAVTNATILITSQPRDLTVLEYHPASFTVAAILTNGPQGALSYQWQSNGVDVAGATGPSFTLPLATLANNGDQFRVQLSAPGVTTVYSATATLTVQKDTQPPYVISTAGLTNYDISVTFNKPLDPTTAGDLTRYTLAGGLPIDSASLLADQQTVLLMTSQLIGSTYALQVTGVKDLAGNAASLSVTGVVVNLTVQDLGNLPSPSVVFARAPSVLEAQVSGGAIWFNADSGNLISEPRNGDFDVRVQVTKTSGGDANSNMMLDARESADPSSRHVAITVYPTQRNWTAFARTAYGGASGVLGGNWRIAWPAGVDFPNVWLRLKYSGGAFTTYGSTNGLDWIQVGDTYTPDTPYSGTIVGLATAVTDAGQSPLQAEYSNFGDFALTNATIVITSQPQSVTVQENHPATFTVAATLQNGPQGALSYQWQTNGVDLVGATSSSYTVALPRLPDSGTQFRVRVSAPGLAPVYSAAATLTVQRDTIPPQGVSAYALVSSTVDVRFDELLDPTAADPTRYSLDGGATVQSAQLAPDGQTVVLGVSGLSSPQFTLSFTGVADLAGNLATNTIKGTYANAGFTFVDIGTVTESGVLVAADPSGLGVEAGGLDIFGTADSFNFIYETLTNDFDVRLQIDNVGFVNGSTRGGLMVRQDATAGSPNLFVGTYAQYGDNHWVATERSTAGGPTVIVNNGYQARDAGFAFPNAWVRLKRAGQTFTTYHSNNGFDWVQVGDNIADVSLPETVLVGIASSSIDTLNNPQQAAQFAYSNFGPVVARPQLQIALTISGDVLLSWPANANGFQLQQASQLGSEAAWLVVTNASVVSGASQQVTLPLTSGPAFYRLAHSPSTTSCGTGTLRVKWVTVRS